MSGDDEVLLRFLRESIHPVVRADVTEAARLCQLYNTFLQNDGFQLVEQTRLSNKAVYVGRYVGVVATPGITAARAVFAGTDLGYIAQQITRMESAVNSDPDLAIGTAKELIESCCKTILAERGVEVSESTDISILVKLTTKELELTPSQIPEQAKAAEIFAKCEGNRLSI
jgi:AbiJ-like protein